MNGLPEIPAGWRWSTVQDVGRLDLGRQRHPDWHNGPEMRPYLRVANVFEDRIDTSDVKEMDFSGGVFDRYKLNVGDVLLNEGQSPEFLGRPAIYRGIPENVAFTNTLLRFRAGPDVTPEWALIVFRRHMHARRFIRESRITTNIAHLSSSRLKTVEFPVPPLAEQRQIAEFLEDHLSRLDAADAGLRHSTRRLLAFHHAFLRTVLLGVDVPGLRECRLLPEAGVNDGTLPPLPVGWQWLRLGDVADVVGGVTKDSKRQSDPAFVEVPYLRVANVQRGHLNLDNVATIRVAPAKADALRLQPGDVLLNEGGDRDKLARGWVWEGQIDGCIHQNHVFRARVREGLIDPRLLSWAANTLGAPWAENNGKQTTNLASISLSKIRLMPIPVPLRDVQPGLVQQISDQLAGIDRLAKQVKSGLDRSQALRKSLLDAAFSGRLTGLASDVDMVEELAGV